MVSNKPAMTTMMNPMATNQQQANPFGVAMATSNQPTMNQMMFPQQQNNFMTSQQPSMMTSQQQMFPMMQQQHMGGFMTSQQMMGGNQQSGNQNIWGNPQPSNGGGSTNPFMWKSFDSGISLFSVEIFSYKRVYDLFFQEFLIQFPLKKDFFLLKKFLSWRENYEIFFFQKILILANLLQIPALKVIFCFFCWKIIVFVYFLQKKIDKFIIKIIKSYPLIWFLKFYISRLIKSVVSKYV